ncbi:MAG: tetratricopeptide repeat protein [Isosphaeraceae bacterium]
MIRLKPDDAGAHGNLGHALRASGDLPGRGRTYREAIRLRPDDAGAHVGLGLALFTMGDLPPRSRRTAR